MTQPKVNGCICQVCADRGVECQRIAVRDEDECAPCAIGNHRRRTMADDMAARDEENGPRAWWDDGIEPPMDLR